MMCEHRATVDFSDTRQYCRECDSVVSLYGRAIPAERYLVLLVCRALTAESDKYRSVFQTIGKSLREVRGERV